MDLIAFFIVLLGATLVSNGYMLMGIVLVAAPLAALAILLERVHKPWLLLPFTFASWFLVLPLAFLATFVLRSQALYAFPLGMALYYYGCVTLVERNARYVLWGGRISVAQCYAYRAARCLLAGCFSGLYNVCDFSGRSPGFCVWVAAKTPGGLTSGWSVAAQNQAASWRNATV